MNTNTHPVRALIAKWRRQAAEHGTRTFTGNDHAMFANELEAALASAPPSAPAGVEGLVAKLRAVLCDPEGNVCIEGSDADCAEVQGALDALETLSQQPAAPSVEAVGEWVLVPREPTDAMLRAAQSAWLNDTLRRTTTMWRAMLEAAPQQPAAVDEAPTWSRQQPTVPGIYGIRGFNLCRPASEQFEAVVVVREHGGELVCNLHESTSEDDLESWAPICDLDPDFEWRVFVPGWQQGGA